MGGVTFTLGSQITFVVWRCWVGLVSQRSGRPPSECIDVVSPPVRIRVAGGVHDVEMRGRATFKMEWQATFKVQRCLAVSISNGAMGHAQSAEVPGLATVKMK